MSRPVVCTQSLFCVRRTPVFVVCNTRALTWLISQVRFWDVASGGVHPSLFWCVTQTLTWLISQVRFWDVASGKEVRQVAGSEFAFVEGPAAEHKTNQHLLTASEDMLLITELLPHEGQQRDAAAMPVACFKAPQRITSVRCHGAAIFAGCSGGAVCLLQAPFLAA